MKKFKLFLLAAVAVLPVLQSCNDSDVEGADSMALVTILNPGGLSGTFYFKADNGQTLYPSQFAVPTGGYNPEDGQRAFIYYSLLEEKSQQDRFDCLISAGYFTCSFQIKVTGSEKHKISLVRSASADDTEDPDYTLLELRHKPDDMGSDTPVARSSMASFKLNSYDPAVTQKKGLKIRYKDFDGNLRTALIDYTE